MASRIKIRIKILLAAAMLLTAVFCFAGLCVQTVKKSEAIPFPVIMYHSVSSKPESKYNVSPECFENDIKYLLEKGYTPVTFADLYAYQNGAQLPAKPVMLTLDDGYLNNYLHVFPVLQKYNVKCVIAVIGKLTDANYLKEPPPYSERNSRLNYEQIAEMHKSGLVEIQNHSYNLHGFGKNGTRLGMRPLSGETYDDYKKVLNDDLKLLDKKLLEKCGIVTTAVALPFGEYCRETITIISELGYKGALTCDDGINNLTRESDLLRLRRFNRAAGKPSEEFFRGICP